MARTSRIIVANWKMNPETLPEARRLFARIKKASARTRNVRTIIAPPIVFLADLALSYGGVCVSFAAQDVFFERKGSHTGEVSVPQVASVGAQYVIIGHSERRARGEENDEVHKKVKAALSGGLSVILCVGERERDEDGDYLSFITEEISSALRKVRKEELKQIVIAYEPIWAIGKTARDAMKPSDMHEMSLFIRKILAGLYDRAAASRPRILYGGSAEPANVKALLAEGEVDGFLVGHASLDAESFKAILKIASNR